MTSRMPPVRKIEVLITDVDGKKTKVLEAYMPHVTFSFQYPINQFYAMGQLAPIQEHTGRVEFSFKGEGLTARPRKPKKQKPLSKRALKKLMEQSDAMDDWE